MSQEEIDALPEELRQRFPQVVADLRDGVIDQVPQTVINQLPASVVDRIPESLLASSVNTTFVIALAIIAGVSLLGFFFGVAKAAAKASLFFLVVAAIAGFLLYAQY